MSCPINNGQEFFEGVLAELHKIKRNSQKFDLKGFVKMMYDKVEEEVGGDESRRGLATDVIKNLPKAIMASFADVPLLLYLSNNGLNILELTSLDNQFEAVQAKDDKTEAQVLEETVAGVLGLGPKQAEIAKDVREKVLFGDSQSQNPRVQKLKSESFEGKPYTISSTTMVTYELVGPDGKTITQTKAKEKGILDQTKKVLREDTVYYANFIRHIAPAIETASAVAGRVLLPGTNVPIYLTTRPLSAIPSNQKYESFTAEFMREKYDMVQIITDRAGNPIFFDEKFNITSEKNGKMIYYRFRKEESSIQNISDAVKSHLKNYIYTREAQGQVITDQDLAVEEALFRKRYAAQIKYKNDTVDYIKKNPQNFLVSEITGFSNGFVDSKFFRATPLRAVNTSGQPVSINIVESRGQFGRSYSVLKVGNQPSVGIYSYGIPDNYLDLITNLLTEDVYDSEDLTKKVLSNASKSYIVDQYIYKSKSDFAVSKIEDDKFIVKLGKSGEQTVDKAKAKELIRNYLTQKQDIETEDGQKSINKILNISKNYLNEPGLFKDFTLEPAENGRFKMVPTGKSYTDFIFDNFTIEGDIDGNGVIRGENPYLTFSIKNIEESRDKLSPPKQAPVTPTFDFSQIPDITGPADIPGNSLDDIFNQIKNNKKLEKTLAQKALNKNEFASDEELKEVLQLTEDWYKSTKLNKEFKLNTLFNVVNSNAVATWVPNAITLYAGSDYTDLFHEAYHGFTQKFLTKNEKFGLWNELKEAKGDATFTTYKGQTKTFKEATFRELDEYLAEEFRGYMISNAKQEIGRRKADSIFSRIFNFLKKLFGRSVGKDSVLKSATTYDTTLPLISEIFQKLALGNINEYVPSDDNIIDKYLEKSIVSEDGMDALTKTESNQVNLAASSIISKLADRLNESQGTSEYTTQLLVKPSNRVLAYKYVQQSFNNRLAELAQNYRKLVSEQPAEGTPQYDDYAGKKAQLEYAIRVLKTTVDNFGDPDNRKNTFGFVKFFEEFGFPVLHLKDLEQDEDFDETTYIPEQQRGYELSGNENAMTELASKQTLALVESLHLPKKNPKGGFVEPVLDTKTGILKYEFEKDVFGFDKLVDFDTVWNRLSQILNDTNPDEEVFKSRLAQEAQNYPWIYQLLEKLGDENTMNAWTSSVWAGFVKDFNFIRIKLKALLVEQQKASDGTQSVSATFGVTSSSSKAAATEWEENFQLNMRNPYMIYDETGNKLNIEKVLNDFKSNYIGRELEFFRAIGINLSNKPEVAKEILTSPTKKGVGRIQNWLSKLSDLQDAGFEVRSIRDIVIGRPDMQVRGLDLTFPNIDTIYKKLQALHLKYADDRSDFMALRPDNNAQYEFTRNSTVTVQLRGLNQPATYAEMINDLRYKHYDMRINPFIEDSYIMNDLYNLKGDGSRRKDAFGYKNAQIDISNLSGTSFLVNDIGDGLANIDLDDYSKLLQDIHVLMLNGYTEGPRAAGKPFTLLMGSNSRDFYIGPEEFITVGTSIQATAPQKVVSQMIKYLSAEVERIKWLQNNPDSFAAKSPVGKKKYGQVGTEFVIFSKILSETTKTEIKNLIKDLQDVKLKDYLNTPTESVQNLRNTIAFEVLQYFGRVSNDIVTAYTAVKKIYPEANLYLDTNVLNTVRERAGKKGITAAIADQSIQAAVMQTYAYNSWVHNLELSLILFGDPAIYDHTKEDFSKRIAPFQSPGVFPILSKPRLNYANTVLGKPYVNSSWFKGTKPDKIRAFGETANAVIFQEAIRKSIYLDTWTKSVTDADIKALKRTETYKNADASMRQALENQVTSEVKVMMDEAYEAMKEGDGQGWGVFDFYRFLSDAMHAWSPQQEQLYQDILAKKEITLTNTELLKIFPVLKMQFTGPFLNAGLPVSGLFKFSIFPLIPNVIENTFLEDIHNKLVEQGGDFATYESGSKLGGVSSPLWKNVEDRTTELNDPGYKMFMNAIHLGYFKKQAENKDEFKKSTNLATQLRSIITNNFNEFGVPNDFNPDDTPEERIAAWNKLEDVQKEAMPKYKAYQRYKKALLDLTNENIKKTYARFGQTKGGKKNVEELVKYLKEQLATLKLPSHVIDNISFDPTTGKISNDLSLSFGADTIEKLLTSIINTTIVKPKVTGDQLVQVSNSGFMSKDYADLIPEEYIDKPEEKMEYMMKYLGSGDLPSYREDADGSIIPQGVKIAMRKEFKPLLGLDDVQQKAQDDNITPLRALNLLIRDENWLNRKPTYLNGKSNRDLTIFVSVRIPTAKENFIEYNQVYEFLPESAGPIFVGPMEMVGKSGTDFDNDKQVSYFPNIRFRRAFTKEVLDSYKDLYASDGLDLSPKNLNRVLDFVEENGTDDLSEKDSMVYNIASRSQEKTVEFSGTGIKGSQNELLFAMEDMIKYNMSLSDFVRPVTIVNAKDLADKAAKKLASETAYNPKRNQDGSLGKSINPTSIFEPLFNIKKLDENSIGFKALGIGAVGIKYNPLYNAANLALANNYMTGTNNKYSKNVSVRFKHNKLYINDTFYISLASTYSADSYKKIANQLEELLNGWVDVEKDAWIFYLNGVKIVAPVMLTLLEAGVAQADIAQFVNQPIVREYVKRQGLLTSPFASILGIAPKSKSLTQFKSRKDMMKSILMQKDENGLQLAQTADWLSDPKSKSDSLLKSLELKPLEEKERVETFPFNKLLEKAMETFDLKFEEKNGYALTSDNLFNAEVLAKNVGKPFGNYSTEDIAVLFHYFRSEDLSKASKDIKVNINFDTKKETTIFDMTQKSAMGKALSQDPRFYGPAVEKVFGDSVISMFNVAEVAEDLLGNDLFNLREGKDVNQFISGRLADFNATSAQTFDDLSDTVKEFKNGLVQFLLQNYINEVDIDKLKSFSGLAVKDEIVVEDVPSLRSFGAFVQNGILYVNRPALKQNYSNLGSADYSSMAVGTAPVNFQMFSTEKEYMNFVLTREVLRDTLNIEDIMASKEFAEAKKRIIDTNARLNTIGGVPIVVKSITSTAESEYDQLVLDVVKEQGLKTEGFSKKKESTDEVDQAYNDMIAGQYNLTAVDEKQIKIDILNLERSNGTVIFGNVNNVSVKILEEVAAKRNIPIILNPSAFILRKFLSENNVTKLHIVNNITNVSDKNKETYKNILTLALKPVAASAGGTILRQAYEQVLRDKALDSVYNNYKIFRGTPDGGLSYAEIVYNLKNDYPGIEEAYPLLSTEGLRIAQEKGNKTGFKTLKLATKRPSQNYLERLREDYDNLSNPARNTFNIPYVEKERIARIISMLPMVISLSTGISAKGEHALWQAVPDSSILPLKKQAASAAMVDGVLPNNVLDSYLRAFQMQNNKSRYVLRSRYRNYTTSGVFRKMTASESVPSAEDPSKQPTGSVAITFATDPLGNRVYDIKKTEPSEIEKLVRIQPNNIFLFNGSTNPDFRFANGRNVAGIMNSLAIKYPNVLPVRTFNMQYTSNDSLSDETYGDNIKMIDEDLDKVQAYIDTLSEESTVMMPGLGLGQTLLGASDFKKISPNAVMAKAPKTFLYLSQQLAKRFGIQNINSDSEVAFEKVGPADATYVTDAMVLEVINQRLCFKL